MHLDFVTLHAVMSLTQIMMGCYQLVIWRDNRQERALLFWAFTNFFCSVTSFWFTMQGTLHPILSVVIPAVGLTGFVAGFWLGVRAFLNRPLPWIRVSLILGAQICVATYYSIVEPILWVRFVYNALTTSLLCSLICRDIFAARRESGFLSFRLMMGVFAFHGIIFFAGAINGLIERPIGNYADLNNGTAHYAILEGLIAFFIASICAAVVIPERLKAALNHAAITDPLTGLPNRLRFQGLLNEDLKLHRSQPGSLAVVYLDLDGFKEVNDNNGHHVGDTLLKEISRRLRLVVPATARMARMGGDEFAFVVTDRDALTAAHTLSELILDTIRQPVATEARSVAILGSIGIATNDPSDIGGTEIMRRADIAMYAAKRAGKAQIAQFHRDMDAELIEFAWLKNELKQALDAEALSIAYQPKYRLSAGQEPQLVGVEALARWQHPERGAISPAQFIPVAEQCGLIGRLGDWILRKAIHDARDWTDLTVSVNLSPAQSINRDLVLNTLQILQQAHVLPRRLELEITEGVLLQADRDVLNSLQALRTAGIQLALDDFGTGYSSLSYLRDFAFDTLKIDRGFVCALVDSPQARSITQSVIGMAKALNLEIIAEGVESVAELDLLQIMGCDIVQGYLLCKPVPATEINKLVQMELSRVA
jgi:diguanylate cyclase (GGDEF)-like protein